MNDFVKGTFGEDNDPFAAIPISKRNSKRLPLGVCKRLRAATVNEQLVLHDRLRRIPFSP